jgi:hypothetical protein
MDILLFFRKTVVIHAIFNIIAYFFHVSKIQTTGFLWICQCLRLLMWLLSNGQTNPKLLKNNLVRFSDYYKRCQQSTNPTRGLDA